MVGKPISKTQTTATSNADCNFIIDQWFTIPTKKEKQSSTVAFLRLFHIHIAKWEASPESGRHGYSLETAPETGSGRFETSHPVLMPVLKLVLKPVLELDLKQVFLSRCQF